MPPLTSLPPEALPAVEALRSHRRWIVASHMNPDGDTLGSAIALKQLLRALGHEVHHFCPDPPPRSFGFLAGAEAVETTLPAGDGWGLAALDAADLGRFGEAWASKLARLSPLVVIDHHISNKSFGTYNLILPHDAATGEVVFRLFEQLGIDIDELSANALYTAIATDTGSFRYDGTSPLTHRMVARLIECGVRPGWINQQLFERMARTTLLLHSRALAEAQFLSDGLVATTYVTRKMLADAGALDEECEGIVERLRAIEGVDTAIFLRELSDGRLKASFRSKGRVDVNAVAGRFGGGGHVRASGCTLAPGPVLEALARLAAAVGEQLGQLAGRS